jgi:hypothetical protein
MPDDRCFESNGTYIHTKGAHSEAVDPLTVAPKVAGDQNNRAWEGQVTTEQQERLLAILDANRKKPHRQKRTTPDLDIEKLKSVREQAEKGRIT